MASVDDDFRSDTGTAGVLQVDGNAVKGRIENGGDHDWFKVTLAAGQTYSFHLDRSLQTDDDLFTKGGWPMMALRDASGHQVASNLRPNSAFSNTGYFNFTATKAGDYYIDLNSPYDHITGDYAIKAVLGVPDDYTNDLGTKGYVPQGGSIQGTLENGLDIDWFKTTLAKGHAYMIQMLGADNGGGTLGPDASLFMQVYSPSTATIGMAGSIGGNGPSVYVKADISGDYVIDIQNDDRVHDAAGSYTVKVTEVPVDDYGDQTYDPDVAKLTIGSTLYGRTGHIGDYDAFGVDVKAGQTYAISMRHEAQAFLSIHGTGMQGQTMIRPRVADGTAQYIFTANESGTIYMAVFENQGSLGQYSLLVQNVAKEIVLPKLVSIATTTNGGYWVPGSAIVMTFSENIRSDTGALFMTDRTADNWHQYWYTGQDIAVNGNTLTWHLPAKLDSGSNYQLDLKAGFVKDLAGNAIADSGSFVLKTRADDKQFVGWPDTDRFSAFSSGNDTFDGKEGIDVVFYDDNRSNFIITKTAVGYSVKDLTSKLGTDTLLNTERIVFSDTSYALDVDGIAGQAYRLYRAAFDRDPDSQGLGYWISHMDKGTTLNQVANFFLASEEFINKYGTTTDTAFVNKLYANVLHRAPDVAGLQYWVGHLKTDISRAEALAFFSESPENHANVATIIGSGFEYTAMLG